MNPAEPDVLMAGIFVCPKGITQNACSADKPSPKITTQISFYTLQTSFVSWRLYYTIISIDKGTDATPVLGIQLPDYRDALRWLLKLHGCRAPATVVNCSELLEFPEAARGPVDLGYSGPELSESTRFPVLAVQL
ncbi:hypothetical protein BKA67DRAFT_540252 [Truncatella angustata]|uniref:Uncharacterized protein n=1 Tax=Truncatella angustata TaxID=152316 RepID=A0A9P8RIP4_9PEZI|nr:uncharacterized protein BKA67DRAFT_540252 [Truncatella angustata]KAH6646764.1 hypothetical protein BKA67DRAFT_540252 [Truncatella angustata]